MELGFYCEQLAEMRVHDLNTLHRLNRMLESVDDLVQDNSIDNVAELARQQSLLMRASGQTACMLHNDAHVAVHITVPASCVDTLYRIQRLDADIWPAVRKYLQNHQTAISYGQETLWFEFFRAFGNTDNVRMFYA